MKIPLCALALALFVVASITSAAQQTPSYEVDPKTKWATGARLTPADELKKQLDAGTVMIIDVRPRASYERETLPGAINVPLEQLEPHLKKISTDTYIVFT